VDKVSLGGLDATWLGCSASWGSQDAKSLTIKATKSALISLDDHLEIINNQIEPRCAEIRLELAPRMHR
jgi:hypothetical protein